MDRDEAVKSYFDLGETLKKKSSECCEDARKTTRDATDKIKKQKLRLDKLLEKLESEEEG